MATRAGSRTLPCIPAPRPRDRTGASSRSSSALPRKTVTPRWRACASTSSSSRVLPMPASPSRKTTWLRPATTRWMTDSSTADSSARPTSGGPACAVGAQGIHSRNHPVRGRAIGRRGAPLSDRRRTARTSESTLSRPSHPENERTSTTSACRAGRPTFCGPSDT